MLYLEGLSDAVLDYWGNARRGIGLSRLSVMLVLSQVIVVESIDVRIESLGQSDFVCSYLCKLSFFSFSKMETPISHRLMCMLNGR